MTACAPRITTEQVMALRQDLVQQIEAELDLIDDPAIVGYVNELGQRIVAVADPRNGSRGCSATATPSRPSGAR